MNRFAVAALLFSASGVVIAYATAEHRDLAAGLLKFYWFRLADFAVPMSVSLGCVVLCQQWSVARPRWGRVAWTLAVLAPAVMIGKQYLELQLDFRPGAERQSRAVGRRSAEEATQRYRAWREVCDWIQHQTPPDSRFLTPRNQQTFKWYAHRAELACWKDIPQDAESIVLWWKTFRVVYTPKVSRRGLGLWTDRSLVQFARRHEIDYIVVDRDRTARALGLPASTPAPFAATATRSPAATLKSIASHPDHDARPIARPIARPPRSATAAASAGPPSAPTDGRRTGLRTARWPGRLGRAGCRRAGLPLSRSGGLEDPVDLATRSYDRPRTPNLLSRRDQ